MSIIAIDFNEYCVLLGVLINITVMHIGLKEEN